MCCWPSANSLELLMGNHERHSPVDKRTVASGEAKAKIGSSIGSDHNLASHFLDDGGHRLPAGNCISAINPQAEGSRFANCFRQYAAIDAAGAGKDEAMQRGEAKVNAAKLCQGPDGQIAREQERGVVALDAIDP